METYSLLREFADSWMLLALFGFFLAAVLRVFLPRTNAAHRDSKEIPFRHEDAPAPETDNATRKEARK